MRIEQLGHFIAVLDCGSIREAARQWGLTQPAISKSLKLLEAEMEVELFTRGRNGITATPAGLTFATRARAIHAELRKAREELAQGYQPGDAQVAFGVGQATMMLLVGQSIERFRAKWPQARIKIVEGLPYTLLPRVRDETLDFALGGHIEGMHDGLNFKPLFQSARVVVARKNHPLAKARSLKDLRGSEWIRTPPLEAVNGPLEQIFSAAGLPTPASPVHCDSYHSATVMLASSDMLALMSERQLQTPYGQAYLQAIGVREPIPGFTVGMYTRGDVPMTPAAAALARIVTTLSKTLRDLG